MTAGALEGGAWFGAAQVQRCCGEAVERLMGSSECPGPTLGWCSGVKCLSSSQGIALKCLLSQTSSKFCNRFFSWFFF